MQFFLDFILPLLKSHFFIGIAIITISFVVIKGILYYLEERTPVSKTSDRSYYQHVSLLIEAEMDEKFHEVKSMKKDIQKIEEEIVTSKYSKEWISAFKEETSKLKTNLATLSDTEKNEIINKLKQRIEQDESETFIQEIRNKLNKEDKQIKIKQEIERITEKIIHRLHNSLSLSISRSNLNLALGIFITSIGFIYLFILIFSGQQNLNTPLDFLKYYLPKLSLIIFIEIFAYFFLKLYKETLIEIKYIQNEITNIESKRLATEIAIYSNDERNLQKIISTLSETERNHILEKDQTTVNIEKAKIDSESTSSLFNAFSAIINKKS
ncbi:MAG: hypothetical protein KAG28_05425 [Cocleimonas sp.]|nr:hypothetical protein [Cocleimonas sp.]